MRTELPSPGSVRPLPVLDPGQTRQALIERCGADPDDAEAAAEAVAAVNDSPPLLARADSMYQSIAADMGGRLWVRWPKPAPGDPLAERLLGVYPLVAAIPLMTEFHRGIGLDEAYGTMLLQDVGEKLRLNRRMYGVPCLDVAFWFTAHVRGTIYQLGRLQFCMEGTTAMPRMGMHIRGEGGPLTPEAVSSAVREATAFFPERFGALFPPRRPLSFMCSSWLLDPQLRDWLPERSNILAFGSLFDLVGPADYANAGGHDDIWRFVFARTPDTPLEDLPADNTLQRSMLAGLREGVAFQTRLGGLSRSRLG